MTGNTITLDSTFHGQYTLEQLKRIVEDQDIHVLEEGNNVFLHADMFNERIGIVTITHKGVTIQEVDEEEYMHGWAYELVEDWERQYG